MAELDNKKFWVVVGSMWVAIIACIGLCVAILFKLNSPVPPSPSPATGLAGLVADKAVAAQIAEFYSAFSEAVKDESLKTSGQFRDSQRIAARILKATAAIPDQPQLNEPISERIKSAIGDDDAQLTPESREALSAALAGVAEALK